MSSHMQVVHQRTQNIDNRVTQPNSGASMRTVRRKQARKAAKAERKARIAERMAQNPTLVRF